jgi:hypothetical protein
VYGKEKGYEKSQHKIEEILSTNIPPATPHPHPHPHPHTKKRRYKMPLSTINILMIYLCLEKIIVLLALKLRMLGRCCINHSKI